MLGAMMILPLLAAVVVAALGVTWYFADNEKVFGPATANRVTFKRVLLNFLDDLRELAALDRIVCFARRLWAFWGPRLTNRALIAVIMGDIAIVASGQDVWTFIGGHPLLIAGIVLMHLLTPVSPAGAPASLPKLEPGGLRGPGAEYEARGGARA
jgi:hypothetical protein